MRVLFLFLLSVLSKRLRFETGENDEYKKLQPNIVFVLFDDVGWADLGFNNLKITTTPFMDKMAKQGTKFTQVDLKIKGRFKYLSLMLLIVVLQQEPPF